MAFIVFRVHIDAGRGYVGMPQVVANSLEVHLVALVSTCRVPEPVRRRLFHMCSRALVLRPKRSKASCGFPKHIFDQFVHRASRHGAGSANDGVSSFSVQ